MIYRWFLAVYRKLNHVLQNVSKFTPQLVVVSLCNTHIESCVSLSVCVWWDGVGIIHTIWIRIPVKMLVSQNQSSVLKKKSCRNWKQWVRSKQRCPATPALLSMTLWSGKNKTTQPTAGNLIIALGPEYKHSGGQRHIENLSFKITKPYVDCSLILCLL